MLRIVNIALGLDDGEAELRIQAAKLLRIRPQDLLWPESPDRIGK